VDAQTQAADLLPSIEPLYNFVLHGVPLPDATAQAIPGLNVMRRLRCLDEWLKLRLMELPDALIFLDVDPAVALARLVAKGGQLDRHENLDDLTQAQTMYRRTAQFFRRQRGTDTLAIIDTTNLSLGQTLRQALDFVRGLHPHTGELAKKGRILGSADQELSQVWGIARKVLTYQYLVRCILFNLHRGNARELTFPLSTLGRRSLREGYSANIMQAIYLRDSHKYGLLDRLFLDYPLHRAVYHRLRTLTRVVEHEFRHRLGQLLPGDTIKVLTAPSGYAFDLLQPLECIARTTQVDLQSVHVWASDLDPHGCIERKLARSCRRLGVTMDFMRGDLTSDEMRDRFERSGPFDVVVFVGLSYWISKTHLICFLRLIRDRLLASGGVLLTDCFTQDTYALSGKQMGYKNNFYSPEDYASLLAYCGFEFNDIVWKSGPEGINHTFVARVPLSLHPARAWPVLPVTVGCDGFADPRSQAVDVSPRPR
jgi:SAM-dependent methyltransferase